MLKLNTIENTAVYLNPRYIVSVESINQCAAHENTHTHIEMSNDINWCVLEEVPAIITLGWGISTV